AALHLDRIARMVRQHEGRCVIGWIVAPPALPALVRPGTADWPEHIAAEDERAEPVHRTMCVSLIDAVRTAVLTNHCPEHARTEHPLVQFRPTLAERIFTALVRPCSEAVERDRKACNANFCHNVLPFISGGFPIVTCNQLQTMPTGAIVQAVFGDANGRRSPV